MRVLVVDNYDSFTFNLVQYIGALGAEVTVVRNDAVDADQAAEQEPERLVVSPGPGRPEDTGVSIELIRKLGGMGVPTLGVCLGHQAIGVAFGGTVASAPTPRHGKTSDIRHDGQGLFEGLPSPLTATRYHSLAVVDPGPDLTVTATSDDDVVQGLRHRSLPIEGVQFHPESIMTTAGMEMLENFLQKPG